MFNLFRCSGSFILVFLLAACASTPPDRPDPDALARIRTIGVMSLAAVTFHRQYTGVTVFNNEYENSDISGWNLDDDYEAQMQSALAGLSRFQAVRIPYDRKSFQTVYVRKQFHAAGVQTAEWPAVEERLKTLAKANALDAIVVLIARGSGDFLANTNQYLRGGPGFYVRSPIAFNSGVSVLYLIVDAVLIDGHTGKPIASRSLGAPREGMWRNMVTRPPLLDVPTELSRTNIGELGEARLGEIRVKLIELPKAAWDPTLRGLLVGNAN
jgi:hypothetical protein